MYKSTSRLLFVLFNALVLTTALACAQSNQSYTLSVLDMRGNPKTITLDNSCLVFGMATWCPHSKELKHLINHPSVKSDLDRVRIVFIFENNEWPTVKDQMDDLVKAGDMTQEDENANLAEFQHRAAGSKLFDPRFLLDLGHEFYRMSQNSSVSPRSFPSLYSATNHAFQGFSSNIFLKFCSEDQFNVAYRNVYHE